jgi:hypothetical protein
LDYVGARFDADTGRLSEFGSDQRILNSYVSQFQQLTGSHAGRLFSTPELEPSYLDRLANSHQGNVQFSEPRGCVTADPEGTLKELYGLLVQSDDYSLVEEGALQPEKPSHFVSEIVEYLCKADPQNKARVKKNIQIKFDGKQLPFDFGYRRPAGNSYFICEAVDLSKGSPAKLVNIVGPTVLKFEIVKDSAAHPVSRCAVIKSPANGNGHHAPFEIERLKKSTDWVMNFGNAADMVELASMIRHDFEDLRL